MTQQPNPTRPGVAVKGENTIVMGLLMVWAATCWVGIAVYHVDPEWTTETVTSLWDGEEEVAPMGEPMAVTAPEDAFSEYEVLAWQAMRMQFHTTPSTDVDLDWCEENYHLGTACPLHGQVDVPEHVYLAWCDGMVRLDPTCIELQRIVRERNIHLEQELQIARALTERAAWCQTHSEHPSCQAQETDVVTEPTAPTLEDAINCDRIFHQSPECPLYGQIEPPN